MSQKQRYIIVAGIVLTVLAGLFPPWRFVFRGPYGASGSRSLGRSFSAPRYLNYYQHVPSDSFYKGRPDWIETTIDFEALTVEWVTLLIVVCGVVLLLKPHPTSTKN